LGTVALSALIIAIIQFVRAVILYIEKQTQSRPPNKLQELIFCVIQCCLRCIQCCLDKINRNALIWTAITGDNFGTAACSSFQLLWANIGRTLAISAVSEVLVFITKLSVAAVTAGISLPIIIKIYPTITSPLMPCVIIFMVSFVVASVFMVVFNSVIDTIFICFLIDEDVNIKAGQPLMCSKSLAELVDSDAMKKESDIMAKAQYERYERWGSQVQPAKKVVDDVTTEGTKSHV
jgi:hypothetical protein